MNTRTKNKIKDAITAQHVISSTDSKLSHCFFTLTYPKVDTSQATKDIGRFWDKVRKYCDKVYPVNAYTIVWVRELTKTATDHFHCTAVLPVHKIPKANRRYNDILWTVPIYCNDELQRKVFTLNKAWSMSRCGGGEYAKSIYSKNAVRVKGKFIIEDLNRAIRYVSGYMEKAKDVDTTRPIYNMSRELRGWTKPVKVQDALAFVFDPFYGGEMTIIDTVMKMTDAELQAKLGGRYKVEEILLKNKSNGLKYTAKTYRTDFATIGKVRQDLSAMLYQKLQSEVIREKKDHSIKLAKINNKMNQFIQESIDF